MSAISLRNVLLVDATVLARPGQSLRLVVTAGRVRIDALAPG
jgi:hypothetical protein